MFRNIEVKPVFPFIVFILLSIQVNAQFTITESFKGNASNDIIIGDGAYLTSGVADPVNDGWLRLTEDVGNRKGFAYVNKSFPSTLGVLVDFEYIMWRSRNDSNNGADGIGVFLFDGTVEPQDFNLGGYGGSLGYAPNTNAGTQQGVTGGYIGIGLDSYGNFGNNNEGRIGRIAMDGNNAAEVPNTVVLRGPTTNSSSTTNRFLAGAKIGDRSGTANTIRARNEIDYNTVTSIRPDYSTFYRRIQIEIIPLGGSAGYEIIVRWTKTYDGNFTQLITYTTSDVPPNLLKLGFAASTGGSFNFHEIRNVLVTTPGNLRVIKKTDKSTLRSIDVGNNENEISYNIEIVNDTDGALENIQFEDKLTDGEGNVLDPSVFEITNITAEGFLAGTSLPVNSSINEFTGSLNLSANSAGIIKVSGRLKEVPAGNIVTNVVSALPTDISDEDLGNNTSVVNTPVIAEGIDMVVNKTVDQSCLDSTNGNRFTLEVTNLGSNNLNYSSTNQVVVTETLPPGATIVNPSNSGWSYTNTGSTYTFTKTGSGVLSSGFSFPKIYYTVNASQGYTNSAVVELRSSSSTNAENIEPPENLGNNEDSIEIIPAPLAPTITSPVYYCQGEEAQPLTAAANEGFTLRWFLNEGGTGSNIPFTPSTSTPGSTIYYVAQTNGTCESDLAEIEVIVLENPEAGSISGGEEICSGRIPGVITSQSSGSGNGIVSYRWQFSTDGGIIWEEVFGASGESYQPGVVRTSTLFRRITITETNGFQCESQPTNIIAVTTKRCGIISNPMLSSKAQNN